MSTRRIFAAAAVLTVTVSIVLCQDRTPSSGPQGVLSSAVQRELAAAKRQQPQTRPQPKPKLKRQPPRLFGDLQSAAKKLLPQSKSKSSGWRRSRIRRTGRITFGNTVAARPAQTAPPQKIAPPPSPAPAQASTLTPAPSQYQPSAVEQHLRKLYAQNGGEMPSLDPGTMRMAQTQQQSPYSVRPIKKKTLLGRLFPFARKTRPAAGRPLPSPPIAKSSPQRPTKAQPTPVRTASSTPDSTANLNAGFVPPPPADPVPAVEFPARRLTPPKAAVLPKAPVVEAPGKVQIPNGDDFPSPFPTGSEAEADKGPGLKVAADADGPSLKATPAKKIEAPKKKHADKFSRIAARSGQKGLKGFCPVVLRDKRNLADALPEFRSDFNGRAYYFSSADAKAEFDQQPAKYAPAASGADVILKAQGIDAEGKLDHAVWFRDRLYLFTSTETLKLFTGSPAKFAVVGE